MYESKATPRLGALRTIGEQPDRFDLATVTSRGDAKAGRLLTVGVEWGGRR